MQKVAKLVIFFTICYFVFGYVSLGEEVVTEDSVKQLLIDGNLEEALEGYNILLNESPDNAKYWNNKGIAELRLGNCEDAINSFDNVIKLDKTLLSARINAAEADICLNDLISAIENLEEAVKISPKDIVLWTKLGSLQMETGDYISALSSYKEAYAINSSYPDVDHKRAELNFLTGNYNLAISIYSEIVNTTPDDELAWYNLGVLFDKLGQYDAALNAYNHTVTLNVSNYAAYKNIGNIFWIYNKIPETIDIMNLVTTNAPEYSDAWAIRAMAYKTAGNMKEADSSIAKALELESDEKIREEYADEYAKTLPAVNETTMASQSPLSGTVILFSLFVVTLISTFIVSKNK